MPDGFDIKYTLLPPDLQMRLWVLALDASTSKVNLAYNPGTFHSSLGYDYGGSVRASLGIRRYSLNLAFDPSTRDVNLGVGLVFRGFDFESSADLGHRSVGVTLSYGRKLLPYPDELDKTFNAANGGLLSMASDIRAAPNNPLAWYKLHSNDVTAISKAVGVGRQIADQGSSSDRFGLGLRLNYSPTSGFVIYGGVAYFF
jgi:hypothetical protein